MSDRSHSYDWFLSFPQIYSDGYREYREFFPAFCNTPYLSIELLEVHDKEGEHDGNIISFYSSEYGDQVKIVEQEKSFWGSFFKGVTYGLEYLNLKKYNIIICDISVYGLIKFQIARFINLYI